MKVFKAPEKYNLAGMIGVFLSGSIEQDKAEKWQDRLTEALASDSDLDLERLIVLNPRREEWDASWVQEKENAQFHEQVSWELQAQEASTVIAMYYDPATKSPITLLELGLFSDDRMVVLCPKGYWRKGNVDVVCERYGVTQAETWEDFVKKIKEKILERETKSLTTLWGN
jgi:hypothetical protein